MAMGWSHSVEAHESGKRVLAEKPLKDLMIIMAEWMATDWKDPATMQGPEFDEERYRRTLSGLQFDDESARASGVSASARREHLADLIWKQAEELRTCSNDGSQAWVCPYGCHTVNW